MIHCIQSSTFPTSIQICETNATFTPFQKVMDILLIAMMFPPP
jgi:hypothetical protein